jgi:rare lipoprotein A
LGNPPFYVVDGHRYFVLASAAGYVERGVASWYGPQFHGLRTAIGEPYDMFAMTAAHKTLPLPCYARVTNLQNGRSVVVRINDRGPFVSNRIIDLSYSAAARLGMIRSGTAFVQVETLTPPPPGQLTASLPAVTPAASAAAAGVTSVPALSASDAAALPPANPQLYPSAPKATPSSAPAPAGTPRAAAPPLAANALPGTALSANPGAAHGDLYIQVGAFARAANAWRVARRLREAGVPGVFTLAPGLHQSLLRVRVGPLHDVQQFDTVMNQLQELGFRNARLAQD